MEDGFHFEKDEGGFLAVKNYKLGEKKIFFETSKKTKNSFSVGISVRVTNHPVEKIHSLVNTKNASKSFISLRLSQLTSILNNRDADFERKKFNGVLGSMVSIESMNLYKTNLKSCLKVLILPFFNFFNNQESFYNWLNQPILEDNYNFETAPVWKDAINSLIVSKLVCSEDMNKLYQKWLNQKLPKGQGFDTREELIQLKEILNSAYPV